MTNYFSVLARSSTSATTIASAKFMESHVRNKYQNEKKIEFKTTCTQASTETKKHKRREATTNTG